MESAASIVIATVMEALVQLIDGTAMAAVVSAEGQWS